MNKIAIAAAVTAVLASTAGAASAQTTPAPAAPAAPATPSLGAVIAATPGLSITGYVASTYDYFNTSSTALRAFDTTQNGFKLNQAAVTLAYLPSSGAGAQVTLIGGSDAKILRNGEIPLCVTSAGASGCTNSQFDLNNAFVQYATGPLTVMAGKYSSLAGAETTNPVTDNTISRSLLFWDMEPGALTGVRANYTVAPALTLIAGVNNGWGFTTPAPSTSKTIELGATGAPNKMFSYTADYYRGQSPWFGGSPNGVLQLLDLVGTFNATDALTLAGNIDILSKDNALPNGGKGKANGVALYATYALTPQWGLAARGEYIDDKDGIVSGTNGTSNKLKELTLAVNYALASNLKLSAEVRQDRSNGAIYTKKDGASTTKQTSFELQALYSF